MFVPGWIHPWSEWADPPGGGRASGPAQSVGGVAGRSIQGSFEADDLRRILPFFSLAFALVAAVTQPSSAADLALTVVPVAASLLCGETGPLLVAFRLTADPRLADDLHALVRGNIDNPTDDISWGAPGTLLAALAMSEWTGEPCWADVAHKTASALRARRGDDGLWRQDDDYRGLGTLHGAAGNTLALLRLEPDDALASETAAVLTQHAFRGDGLANWSGTPRPTLARPRDGRICLQWCTGAPGVLAGAWHYLDEALVLAGAELVWQAGAHRDEKGHGLCHGTSGKGFALLKAFARTGDEGWLERARRFAVHGMAPDPWAPT